LPHALPSHARGDLRDDGAAARGGRGRPPPALPHPDRGTASAAGEGARDRGKIEAVVLEATGGPLVATELDLAPPQREEVLVRLGASGCCHSDWNAVDGTAENPCPCVLGHEGAGVVEAVGEGVTRVKVGDVVALSWAPWCGDCDECRRGLPQLCATVWPAMGTGG